MCHFITLVVDTDDRAALDGVLTAHGRRARPWDNPSIAVVLREGERQFLPQGKGCDCGSVLGAEPADSWKRQGPTAEQLRRKGWSEAKVQRSLADRARVGSMPARRHDPDSFELWQAVVEGVLGLPGVSRAGILIHNESLGEAFSAVRRDWQGDRPVREGLESLREDELLMFRSPA